MKGSAWFLLRATQQGMACSGDNPAANGGKQATQLWGCKLVGMVHIDMTEGTQSEM